MFCPKCGIELKEKMKFCFNCGEKLNFESEEDKKKEVDPEKDYDKEKNDTRKEDKEATFAEESNVESKRSEKDEYRTENKVNWEDHFQTQQSTSNLTISDKIMNKCKEKWSQLSLFSKVLTILVAISIFLGLTALLCGKVLSVFIVGVQIALFVVGWLMQKEKIKQNKKWFPYLLVVLAVLLFIPFFNTFTNASSSNGEKDITNKSTVSKEPMYMVVLNIDCEENLLFSKYDLKILIDSSEVGTLKHGKKGTFNVELEKGTHTLEIQSSDSSSVNGSIDIEINQDNSFKYEVSCIKDKVNIKEIEKMNPPIVVSELGDKSYSDVKTLFIDSGFTDVTTKEIKDLSFEKKDNANKVSNITIDGKSDFVKDLSYFKDVKVIIEYHIQQDITMIKDSSAYDGKNYLDVKKEFESMGFTNIKLGKCTSIFSSDTDGEVILVEANSSSFSKGDTFGPGKKIYIKYNAVEKVIEPEHLTVENCNDLKLILSNKAEIDPSYSSFASKYSGQIIEFDGRIDYVVYYKTDKTRYDILVTAGDYNAESQIGPVFKFQDVNASNLGLNTLFLEDEIWVGRNVKIVAKVKSFDSRSGLFLLTPVSVTGR